MSFMSCEREDWDEERDEWLAGNPGESLPDHLLEAPGGVWDPWGCDPCACPACTAAAPSGTAATEAGYEATHYLDGLVLSPLTIGQMVLAAHTKAELARVFGGP